MKKIAAIYLTVMIMICACQKEQKVSGTQTKASGVNPVAPDKNQYSGYSGVVIPGNTSNFYSNYAVDKVVDLISGQNTVVGNVTVANDDEFVYVTYNITDPNVKISQVHMYIGDSTEIPANNSGNPIPGQFPNKITFKKVTVSSYTFAFPAADIENVFSVAAHAVVNGQTAWGEGTPFPNADQWGMYFTVTKYTHPQAG
jgi:hypothetical protein